MGDEFSVKRGRSNPWLVSTIVLVLLVALLIAGNIFGITGNAVSSNNLGKLAGDFVTNKLQVEGTVESVEKVSGVYQVNMNIQGQTVPLFFTKDGNWIAQGSGLIPLAEEEKATTNSNTQTQEEVPKTDKPSVQLFVWGYCPYGVQAQGPFTEVAKLLKDNAEFEVVPYYAGHGDFEAQENKIELCIQKLYPAKFWDYSAKFVTDIYPACSSTKTVECDTTESTKLMKSLGIDSTKVFDCVKTQGSALQTTASNLAQQAGVTGSPTLVVNGVKVNAARNADAFKEAVCSAFNSVPTGCSTTLSSASSAASGNC